MDRQDNILIAEVGGIARSPGKYTFADLVPVLTVSA